jgi:hypothetical protein
VKAARGHCRRETSGAGAGVACARCRAQTDEAFASVSAVSGEDLVEKYWRFRERVVGVHSAERRCDLAKQQLSKLSASV